MTDEPVTPPPVNVWMTRAELAVRLRVSKSATEHWAATGVGPRFAKIGGRALYKLTDVEAWEEAQLRGESA